MRNDIDSNILLSRAETKSPPIPLHDNHASLSHVMRIVVTRRACSAWCPSTATRLLCWAKRLSNAEVWTG